MLYKEIAPKPQDNGYPTSWKTVFAFWPVVVDIAPDGKLVKAWLQNVEYRYYVEGGMMDTYIYPEYRLPGAATAGGLHGSSHSIPFFWLGTFFGGISVLICNMIIGK